VERNLAVKPDSARKDEDIKLRLTRRRSANGSQPQSHWPALDGLRAVAVLGVMVYHLDGGDLLPGGYLGVDVFFVLSGFLITSLLIREWDKRDGRVILRNFYVRRCLRLFPALGCVIAASAAFAVLLELTGNAESRASGQTELLGIPWVILYAGNWARALGLHALGMLGQTWSLAVEEQFYLAWPALFIIVSRYCTRRKRVALWLAFLALTVRIYRLILAHLGYGVNRIYFGTDTHCDGLLVGSAAAFWLMSRKSSSLHSAGYGPLKVLTGLAAASLVILFVFGSLTDCPLEISAATLASLAVVVGLVTGAAPSAVKRALSSSLAVWIGRRSYGLYLWHYIVYIAAISLFDHSAKNSDHGGLSVHQIPIDLVYLGAFFASFMVAALSYRIVELPLLGLKSRFQSEEPNGGTHRVGSHRPVGRHSGPSQRDVPAVE
jgi:peptidoglycan/LPS O-acetylase OafA/YrhL